MNWSHCARLITVYVIASWAAFCAGVTQSAEPTRTFDLGNAVKIDLVRIEPGTFTQGSAAGRPGRGEDEGQRQVTISQAFYLGKTPVTRGQFAQFVAATGYRTEAEKGTSGGAGFENGALVQKPGYNWRNPGFAQTDDHPVVLVTWDDAQAFSKWLSEKTRETVQLPTEAEWEYACRAGTTTDFYSGDGQEAVARIAWYKATAGNGTRPVGQKEANAWGLFDMAGNVDQWCRDWYGPYPPGPVTDPLETKSNLSDKPRRVLRGGSWFKDVKNCRSAARFRSAPGSRNADFGFRISFRPTTMTTAVESSTPSTNQLQAQPQPQAAPAVPQQPMSLPQDRQRMPPQPAAPPTSMVAGGMRSLMALLCPCALVLVGVAVLIFLIVLWRGSKSSRSEPILPVDTPQTSPPRSGHAGTRPRRPPRIVSDGFWLEDPAYSPGSLVRYTCLIDGRPTDGEFTVGPGHQGHFVYTGGTPSEIEIREIVSSSGMPSPDAGEHFGTTGPFLGGVTTPLPPPRVSPVSPPIPPTPPAQPRRGFPPAY
jgi:formylglycine-generating enzyme required for sulfatase activity